MGTAEVEAFLTSLAVEERVAASTQNQAMATLLFCEAGPGSHLVRAAQASLSPIRNSVPEPGWLSTSRLPPWAAIDSRTIARPRPRPLPLVE
jgi:hypothetical protein